MIAYRAIASVSTVTVLTVAILIWTGVMLDDSMPIESFVGLSLGETKQHFQLARAYQRIQYIIYIPFNCCRWARLCHHAKGVRNDCIPVWCASDANDHRSWYARQKEDWQCCLLCIRWYDFRNVYLFIFFTLVS